MRCLKPLFAISLVSSLTLGPLRALDVQDIDPCIGKCNWCDQTCAPTPYEHGTSGQIPNGVTLTVNPGNAFEGCSREIGNELSPRCVTCCPCQQRVGFNFDPGNSGCYLETRQDNGSWTRHNGTVQGSRTTMSAECGSTFLLEWSISDSQGVQVYYTSRGLECSPCTF